MQFVVNGPTAPPAQARHIPNPSRTDDNLVIRGNVIWNTPLEDGGLVGDNNGSGNIGCQAGNPTCNPAQLQAQNAINLFQPQLRDPAHGDFHPAAGSNLFSFAVSPIPDFRWSDAPAPADCSARLLEQRSAARPRWFASRRWQSGGGF